MGPIIRGPVGGAATLVAWILRILHPLGRPFLRFWRLASLRARCAGRIPVSLQFDGPVRVIGRARVTFGENCRLGREVVLETSGPGEIVVGDHVRLNAGCFVVSHARISIGSHTLIGEYASLRDADHGIDGPGPIREQPHRSAPIVIGEDVWIGRGAAVLRGVRIEQGAVVGANSVVTHDVPARVIVAGCPARKLRDRGPSGPGGR